MKHYLIYLLITFTLFSQTHAAEKLDEVLKGYYDAKGGLEVIEGIKSLEVKGKMSMGAMEFPFDMVAKKPNKIYTSFEAQGMKGVQAYDGETGWAIMPFMGKPDPEKMADDQLKQIKDQADIDGPLVNYKEKGHKLELVGETEVEGTPVIELKLTKKNGDVLHIFLDKEHKLEIMTRAKTDMMGQKVEAESYFSDYKPVGKTVMPYAIAIKMNGQVMQNLTFSEIKLNKEVDDKLFVMPEKKSDKAE